jgi:rRNA maturation endonuclease Nob1
MGGQGTFGRLMTLAGFRDSSRPYVCEGCGTSFDVQYHVCPECGGYSVEHCEE